MRLHLINYWKRSPLDKELISNTGLFDGNFYLRKNLDVDAGGMDPLGHYLHSGWKEGRQPSPYFSPKWYLSHYPDIAAAGVEPLQHFIRYGKNEKRRPHYLIDPEYYLSGAPDVAAAGIDPLTHFIFHGDREGRSPHPLFNPAFYRANGPSIGEAAPFAHYAETGAITGRSPCPAFDPSYFIKMYPSEFEEPLLRYVLASPGERPHAHPLFDGDYQTLTALRAAQSADPLADYIQFRSNYAAMDIARGAASIPKPTRARAAWPEKLWDKVGDPPRVSIVVPCYKANLTELRACVRSIQRQTYTNWRLILVDDGSPDTTTMPALRAYARDDSRITALGLANNQGISAATNAGLEHADGEYVAFVDQDDLLMTDALVVVIGDMMEKGADAAYSDQVFISADGAVEEPSLKPAWSPALFAGVMYVGHLLVVRRKLVQAAGGFLSAFDNCQDFEFMLRVSEKTRRIIHVPKVLYGWRRSLTSVASNSNIKGRIETKQAKAVNDHFGRIGFNGVAEADPRVPHRMRIRPTTANRGEVKIDVVCADGVDLAALINVITLAGARAETISKVAPALSPAQCVAQGCANWVVFVAEGMNPTDERWLDHLLMYAECADIAFVAPHVFEPDGRVRSAGLVLDAKAGVLNAYDAARDGDDGAMGTLICDREVSALGADFALVSRERLAALGGLAPVFSSPTWALIDASFRAHSNGFRNIAVATRLLEATAPKAADDLSVTIDREHFLDRNRASLAAGDCYYNPNFASGRADFLPG